jgi:hypothetical protein
MKVTKSNPEAVEEKGTPIEPLVHYESLTAYERLNNSVELSRAIFTIDNEYVLVRNSFRWKKDGETISDAYSAMSMEQVCEERGWKIVERYGEHLAIITPE